MYKYDFIKYLTVYMEGYERTGKESVLQRVTATGFFASLNIKGKKTNIILTAGHFAEKLNRVTFWLRYIDEDRVVTVPLSSKVEWNYCEDADIAYCELEVIEKKFKKITGKGIYATVVTEDRILKQDELENINLLDEVITAGYPNSEASTHHKYPIFKKGYIASLPKDCVEDKEGFICNRRMLRLPCFPQYYTSEISRNTCKRCSGKFFGKFLREYVCAGVYGVGVCERILNRERALRKSATLEKS